jgi:starch synthase
MRICFVSSELAPFAKAGGLGDVSAALPRYLRGAGHDVRVFVPYYARIGTPGQQVLAVDFIQQVPVQLGPHGYHFSLYTTQLPNSDLWAYFVHCPPLYGRPELYTSDVDEHLRFGLLTRAAFEACQRMGFSPHVVHCNDWQTALAPLYLDAHYRWDRLFAATRTLLTIHNIGYQGVFGAGAVNDLGLGPFAALLHQEDLRSGRVNLLKTGLLHATALNTVSPTYAREIQSGPAGAGLEGLLRQRSSTFVGILNGVDYDEWSPEKDPYIPHRFSSADLSGKALAKQALLATLGLRPAADAPVIGIISRLTVQKGLDLLFDVLPWLLQRYDLRIAVLGSGEPRYEQFFGLLQQQHPGRVCYYWGYSNELAHLIEAGADMFLMPSLYEPCGLSQMYSLRYGTVPIVRNTGGLADTVRLFDPKTGSGTGIVFNDYNREGIAWALTTALALYQRPRLWRQMMLNGMAEDFSWERQGAQYVRLYEMLVSA